MTIIYILGLVAYALLFVFSCVVFTLWLRDTKKEDWIFSFILAVFLSTVWPVSLLMLYFHEKMYGKSQDRDDCQ